MWMSKERMITICCGPFGGTMVGRGNSETQGGALALRLLS